MILDIILIILLALSALGGWRSGAFAMLVSIALLVVALLAASALAQKVGGLLHLGPTWAWPVIGFFLTFLLLMIVGGWVKGFLRPKHGLLRGLDGLLGAVLGLARGALILGIVLALFQLIHLPPEHLIEHSHLYPLLLKLTTMFIAVLRPYLHVPVHTPSIVV
ncbi:MAG TPA: CvpA family protein [Candidatus Kapabacteria bacterium]|nr:CvpA family protein [Candidatus Kapabacteria bacterium]